MGLALREVERLETRVLRAEVETRRAARETQRMFDRYFAEKQAREALEARIAALTGRPASADATLSFVEEFLRTLSGPRCRVCLMGETAHRFNCRLMACLDRIHEFFSAS